MMARIPALAASLAGALVLAGCNAAPLSTAASMRVEVEVYKGPLAKEPEVQFGELLGTLDEATNSLEHLRRFLGALTAMDRRKLAPAEYHARLQLVGDLGHARDDVAGMLARAQGFNRWYRERLAGRVETTSQTMAVSPSKTSLEASLTGLTVSAANAEHCRRLPPLPAIPSSPDTRTVRDWATFCLNDADTHLAAMEKNLAEKKYERLRIDYQGLDWLLRNAEWKKRAEAADAAIATAETQMATQGKIMAAYSKAVDDFLAAATEQRGALAYQELKTILDPAKQKDYLIGLLGEIGGLARQLHAKSLFWSGSHIAFSFTGFEGTRLPASLAALLGTYADRMGPRADSLIKQLRGADRNAMALSVALRETSLPAFLQQYVWNRAGGSLTGIQASAEETRDRVRAIERLYTDEHWTNINTVYASGQGTVRMALIKDDIGNWNLKSFDQDPSELLNAYRNVGLAGLKAATGVITAAVSGGGSAAAMQALAMANQLATGTAPGGTPTLGSSNLAELRGQVRTRLEGLHAKAKSEEEELAKEELKLAPVAEKAGQAQHEKKATLNNASARQNDDAAARTAYETALADWAKAKIDADAAALALERVKARKAALPATMLAQAREILASHEKVVDALEGAIVRNRSTTSDLKDALSKTPAQIP